VLSSGIVASRIFTKKEMWFSSYRKSYHDEQNMKAFTTQEVALDDRLLGWWYRIAAPPEVPDEAPLRMRMRVRSGRLMSVVFLMEFAIVIALIIELAVEGRALSNPTAAVVLIPLTLGVILNRRGKTVTAGVLLLVIEEMAVITSNFVIDHSTTSLVLIDSFFFLAPELIAAETIAPWVTFPVTLCNNILTIVLISSLQRTPDLAAALQKGVFFFYAVPVEIQLLVSVVCFLWVSSTYKEMRRANSAEEVSKLTLEMAKQTQAVEQEKERLEESIQQIVSVHMQVANGNWHARVPLDRQNMLWSVAGSLNNLLARLQRQSYDTLKLQKNEEAIQQLLSQVQTARRQGKPLQVYKTGTSLDMVILELAKWTAQQLPRDPISFKQSPDSRL
jgi:hypothetical protein